MTLHSIAKRSLPRRVHLALSILKNGIPPASIPCPNAPPSTSEGGVESPSEAAAEVVLEAGAAESPSEVVLEVDAVESPPEVALEADAVESPPEVAAGANLPDDSTPDATLTEGEAEPSSMVAEDQGPPSGTILPSMIGRSEAEFFTQCAGGPLPPDGEIVDLGCFMSSTAIALARGVIQAGRRDEVIAYDLFEWASWMDGNPTYGIYLPGDCFLPEARRYARDHGDGLITLLQADLSKYQWDGRSISLLLVDAMKSFEVASQIALSFFPALLPGAVLIHQDFKHYYTGWLHVLQYRFRDACQFLDSVPGWGTVAFTVTRRITAQEAWAKSDLGKITDEEVDDAFEYSLGLLPEDQMNNVAAAHVMLFHHLERYDQALARLAKYRMMGLDQYGEFPGMVQNFFPSVHESSLVA